MLYKKILQTILYNGAIPLDLYLVTVIQHYYSHKNPFGMQGDFITSPEISQIFGITICIWIYQIWQKTRIVNKKIILVELGPGNGTLMQDILKFAQNEQEFFSSIQRVILLENSSQMKAVQLQTLKNYHEKGLDISWCNDIQELEQTIKRLQDDVKLVFIANEFFDAIPIKQFIANKDSKFHEVLVAMQNNFDIENSFCLTTNPNLPITTQEMEKIMQYSNCVSSDFKDGDIYEISIAGLSILANIAKFIQSHNASCIIIDYGYSIPSRRSTIKTIYQHQVLENIFSKLGEADISSHVDFGAMQNFIMQNYNNLKISYSTQRDFLYEYHAELVLERFLELSNDSNKSQYLKTRFDKIMNIKEMGEIFKVLIINN
jgi:NADH dehydrogenase [ubiquinone] 1 alpha subcomplex assembly factor 7